jgi:isopenicillin-N epimerase
MTDARNAAGVFGDDPARHWALDPAIRFLNHGSFGACPIPVLEAQARLRERLEWNPIGFFVREFEPLLDAARVTLAEFIGVRPADLVFVPNATTGVNTILRSLTLRPGDELLTTSHEYNACRNALDFVAERAGARVISVTIPFPIAGPEVVVETILARVTPRTRLLLIDHVTSPTALVLPVETLARELEARGIDTLVDGAHGPGMLPLHLDELGAAYYTGNCHKWLCAPKGAGFLHARADRQAGLRPLVISHGTNTTRRDRSRFQLEFDWTGTHDPTPVLCVPEAIRFLGGLWPGGWEELRARNRSLAIEARRVLCDALGITPPCPEAMLGSMAAVPLAIGPEAGPPDGVPCEDPLERVLFDRHRIVVPVLRWHDPPACIVRISAQAYNGREQYEALAAALREDGGAPGTSRFRAPRGSRP